MIVHYICIHAENDFTCDPFCNQWGKVFLHSSSGGLLQNVLRGVEKIRRVGYSFVSGVLKRTGELGYECGESLLLLEMLRRSLLNRVSEWASERERRGERERERERETERWEGRREREREREREWEGKREKEEGRERVKDQCSAQVDFSYSGVNHFIVCQRMILSV